MSGSSATTIIYLIAAVAMFWLLVLRPQQKRAKAQASMISALVPGVEIVTIGGIFGTIVEVSEDRIRIRVADGSELEIAKRAVGSVVPVADEPEVEVDEADDEVQEAPEPADSSDEPTAGTQE